MPVPSARRSVPAPRAIPQMRRTGHKPEPIASRPDVYFTGPLPTSWDRSQQRNQ